MRVSLTLFKRQHVQQNGSNTMFPFLVKFAKSPKIVKNFQKAKKDDKHRIEKKFITNINNR